MISVLKKLLSKKCFSSVDSAILKASLMLAALDGEVSAEELSNFKELAGSCRGCTEESFAKLWDEALRCAGYLLIQARILSEDARVALFVREAEPFFAREVAMEVSEDRARAFDLLSEMAASDGDFSPVEQKAIAALKDRVSARREEVIASLYPRGAR